MAQPARLVRNQSGREEAPIDQDRLIADGQDGARPGEIQTGPQERTLDGVAQEGRQVGEDRAETVAQLLGLDGVEVRETANRSVEGRVPVDTRRSGSVAVRQDRLGEEPGRSRTTALSQQADQAFVTFDDEPVIDPNEVEVG
jgi:hypothetical protein